MSESDESSIDFVDKDDYVIGSGAIEEAWQSGAIHRIVVIFVRRPSDSALLLQKRSFNMEVAAGRWDFSAAGHVDSGEIYQEAANRELYEEIGVRARPNLLGKYFEEYTTEDGKKLNRFYGVFLLESEEFPSHLQTSELDGAAWFLRDELQDMAAKVPERFTDQLFNALRKFPSI